MNRAKPASRSKATEEAARQELREKFLLVRRRMEALAAHLTPEDMQLQSMPDASPARWHLAHTSWFFEEFVLQRFEPGFAPHHPRYSFLFNSYYEAVGERWERSARGLLSRPSAEEILSYRTSVTERTIRLIETLSGRDFSEAAALIELGLNHEEQHQELFCTDIKSAFALNPLFPAAFPLKQAEAGDEPERAAANERWIAFEGGLVEIGHTEGEFSFDNELPQHQVFAQDFLLHGTPVTIGQYQDFIEDGGYDTPSLWLADGWEWKNREQIRRPLYWTEVDGQWFEFTLHGLLPLRRDRILSHVSAYEAFAFAAWHGARLPYETELEIALRGSNADDAQWLDLDGPIHPRLAGRDRKLGSAYGTVWDWTQSSYSAYPGYKPAAGAIGEYNGKFMSSQLVLKGGSCATPPGHIRPSYRNFFPPSARWQFTGIRLARDV